MSEVKRITRYSRDYQGNLQEDPNGSWVLAAGAAIRDKKLMDKIAALQQRLNAADQRIDELTPIPKGWNVHRDGVHFVIQKPGLGGCVADARGNIESTILHELLNDLLATPK